MHHMREPCCSDMGDSLQILVDGEFTSAERPIGYDPVFDEFRTLTHDRSAPPLSLCPWCGAAIAPSRRSAWYARITQLGLTPSDELPPELLTHDWWASAPIWSTNT